VCFKCGVEKPLTYFYKHPKMSDGHVNKCKVCNKKDNVENRASKVEYYREFDNNRAEKHRHKIPGKYAKENPEKRKAHNAVSNALRDGRLVKASACEHCGEERKLIGHHHSYAEEHRLDVVWVCSPCHSVEHKRLIALGINPD
jgi:hypothetical protein